jgi:hypothetical protein
MVASGEHGDRYSASDKGGMLNTTAKTKLGEHTENTEHTNSTPTSHNHDWRAEETLENLDTHLSRQSEVLLDEKMRKLHTQRKNANKRE